MKDRIINFLLVLFWLGGWFFAAWLDHGIESEKKSAYWSGYADARIEDAQAKALARGGQK